MKVYIIVVDFLDGRKSQVLGLYKQYRHAIQEKEILLECGQDIFNSDFEVRIVGPREIAE